MARWAVFDVDGTLLPNMSMERKFFGYLLRNRLLPTRSLVRHIWKGATFVLSKGWGEGTKSNKTYLAGLRVDDVRSYAAMCFMDEIMPAISDDGRLSIESLRECGYRILIVSGSPRFLVEHLENHLYPDFSIATELEIKDGRYTGNIVGIHPFGKRKRTILESLEKKLELDFKASIVFANHYTDVHHMILFGKVVAVNPAWRLKNLANKLGWEVVRWT